MHDLRAGLWTDFIRTTHGDRSAGYVRKTYGTDPRLTAHSPTLVDHLAIICASHVHSASKINVANGYFYDAQIHQDTVNVAFVAYLLRLADILDFDRERTPDSIYRSLTFSSDISFSEWQKHRSVSGWKISTDRIAFAADCEHPTYERSIRSFLDQIDAELLDFHTWNRQLPAEFKHYSLQLPQRVDRSQIRPRLDATTGKPKYHYHDLEFSLSRNEVVALLMTDKLYSNRSLFVRELLQNSLDALRFRNALHTSKGALLSNLRVDFDHSQIDGIDVVRCQDNGAGMDEDIIRRFLTRAGRSYYRSPEFDQQRAAFKDQGCDFDPCARFGIGFMSCFMFGDDIVIHTRRDYGPGLQYGPPLIVEITGLNGLLAVRPGPDNMDPGTSIEIRSSKRSFVVDSYSDPVNLIAVLSGYALAAEFPIGARCQVAPIEDKIEIDPAFQCRPTAVESLKSVTARRFSQDLSKIDARLRGMISIGFIADEKGEPAISNSTSHLVIEQSTHSINRKIVDSHGNAADVRSHMVRQVCCDGILVAGEPGRLHKPPQLGERACNFGFGSASFLIDVRGDLKPELTPARTPPSHSFSREEPSWQRLFNQAGEGYARILEEVWHSTYKTDDPSHIWKLVAGYDLDPYYFRLLDLWKSACVPIVNSSDDPAWVSPAELTDVIVEYAKDKKGSAEHTRTICIGDCKLIETPPAVESLQGSNGPVTKYFFERILLATSQISTCCSKSLSICPQKPASQNVLAHLLHADLGSSVLQGSFSDDLASIICIAEGRSAIVNRQHPVAAHCWPLLMEHWRDLPPLDRLLSLICHGHFADRPFDDQTEPQTWATRTRKQMGLYATAVDWQHAAAPLTPPYDIFLPRIGVQTLTMGHLREWAKLDYEQQ